MANFKCLPWSAWRIFGTLKDGRNLENRPLNVQYYIQLILFRVDVSYCSMHCLFPFPSYTVLVGYVLDILSILKQHTFGMDIYFIPDSIFFMNHNYTPVYGLGYGGRKAASRKGNFVLLFEVLFVP